MTKKTENEYQRLAKNANNVIGNSFGDIAPRTPMRESLQDGDIITFPTDLTGRIVTTKIRNSENTASYFLADVKRGNKELSVAFYPGYLSKARMKYDTEKNEELGMVYTQGEVTDFIQEFDSMDAAIVAIGNKGPVVAKLRESFKTLPYGGEAGKTAYQNCNIFDFNWK